MTLMKNEVEEEGDDPQNEDKAYKDMFKEREKFFKKKAKGMSKPFDKSHGLKSSRAEEVENDEEQLDELSGKLLKRYVTAANKDSNARAEKMKHMSKDEIMKTRPAKKVWARDKNIQLAKSKRGIRNNRLNRARVRATEEVEHDGEPLDELSKGTLKSYIKKANTGEKSGKRREGVNQAIGGVLGKDNFKKIFGKYQKEETEELDERDWSFKAEKATRNKNNTRSNMRQSPYTQRDRDNEKKIPMAKEEVEPLDELSKKTLTSYMNKAAPQVVKLAGQIKSNKGHNSKRTGAKFMSRLKGVSTAKTIVDDED